MRIISSMTTWSKRIGQCKATVDSILLQTRKPDLLVINLDYDNFPNGYADIPSWMCEYIAKYDNFRVNFRLHDLKVWQKIMPTIWSLNDNFKDTIIVTHDDDVTYPETYLAEVEANLLGYDWLCTKSDTYTMRTILCI